MREAVVDANVLLRFLTDQPRDLADRAVVLFETAEREDVALVIPPLIVAEVIYVLQSVYAWNRSRIAPVLLELVSAQVLNFLESGVIVQALEWYRDISGLSFADAYIGALARARGGSGVMSFDRGLRRVPEIAILDDPSRLEE